MPAAIKEIGKTKTLKDSGLLLNSLEVKGYRCFKHLEVEKVGRVNLIVGKNNVGKTALLEALWIYSRRGTFRILFDLLFSRDEVPIYVERTSPIQVTDVRFQKEDLIAEAGNLFSNRPKLSADSKELITIGSRESTIKVQTTRMVDKDGKPTSDFSLFENVWGVRPTGLIIVSTFEDKGQERRSEFYSFENLKSLMLEEPPDPIPSSFVRSRLLDNDALIRIWDDALKNSLEETAIDFLQIIEPKIEYVNFVGTTEGSATRYPITNNGKSKRVPLKSYGEGMTRLLGISLALVQCRNGILLIDEIESGLHFSVLPHLWKLIFVTAKALNVQVFATTHSSDCVEAFAKAASQSPEDGMLFRLERHGADIVAKAIAEEMLVDAVNYDVEVR